MHQNYTVTIPAEVSLTFICGATDGFGNPVDLTKRPDPLDFWFRPDEDVYTLTDGEPLEAE